MELVEVKVDASNTDDKEICVRVPEGYEIDEANSTFKSIKLRKKQPRFSDYDGSFEIYGDHLSYPELTRSYSFLAFHTSEQRDLFFEENHGLVKQFYKL